MVTINSHFLTSPRLSDILDRHEDYWAHLPPNSRIGGAPEMLFEHCELVTDYFKKLCEAHHLEPIIDQLVNGINLSSQSAKDFIKVLFLNVVAFHDYGKVNENYQVSRMKNVDSFKTNHTSSLVPNYGHSFLGAYIFIAYHLEMMMDVGLSGDEEDKMVIVIYAMAYPIFCHHKSHISNVQSALDGSRLESWFDELRKYLDLYKIGFDREMSDYFLKDQFRHHWNAFWDDSRNSFPLFALTKLSFSLLTASDYLATHEYMSGERTVDFGVFDNMDRVNEIVNNVRTTQQHNRNTFSRIESAQFEENDLGEKSRGNLNKLRQQMAVELVRTIRLNTDKRLFYIEAPTGGGKTNLSMLALSELMIANSELNKVFYVFPFTTLITQTYKALKDTLLLNENELVELHSKSGFHSKVRFEEEQADGHYGSAKKDYIDNLFALYPLTVLSHIRFFDALKTNRKDSNYLLHRLANSVVIFDELQTYNPKIWDKMLYLIDEYARYFNVRFILMSATLPKISDLQLPGFEKPLFVDLLPNAEAHIKNPNFSERVKFNFEFFDKRDIEMSELVCALIEKSKLYAGIHGSVHAIIEFIYKKSASAFYDLIEQSTHFFDEIFVLSGTVLEVQRKKIIGFLKDPQNRDRNILLVTTQVVEAGVDIDMDLGFKNISLIDSDEQLAGRVNRNAAKEDCEVYLFRMDDPELLYKGDDRYKVTKTNIRRSEYESILRHKDFKRLYDLVFEKRDKRNNNSGWADNFQNEFLTPGVHKLNYDVVNEKFRIIDQQNESVFVPIELPTLLDNGESVFSDKELLLLSEFGGYREGQRFVDGKAVWSIYEVLIVLGMESRKKAGFDLVATVRFKTLQSVMSKFTFSLFSHSRTVEKIKALGFGEDNYGFLYLSARDTDLNRIYTLEGGLRETELGNDNENLFL